MRRDGVLAMCLFGVACGGAKAAAPAASAVAVPSTAADAGASGPEEPALAMLLDTKGARGTPIGSFFVQRASWEELRVNAHLKLDRDVDWIAVRGPSLDPREDIVVAHLVVPDDSIDKVLAQGADSMALAIPGVSAWIWHGLPNGRVAFRSRPGTLGMAPLALLASRDVIARVVDLGAAQGPLASITVHRTDATRARLPPKMRELRVTIEGAGDGGAEIKADADFDDADSAEAAREKLVGWVDAARARDTNAARALRPLETTASGPSARANLHLTPDTLKILFEWLEHSRM